MATPAMVALFAWIAWEIVQERNAGSRWDNPWLFAFALGTLAAMSAFMLAGLVLTFRMRLTLNHQGLTLRGLFRPRTLRWDEIEGYRWQQNQLFAYPVADQWPMNLSHFSNLSLLGVWLYFYLPNLQSKEIAKEVHEIEHDHQLGLTAEEKTARLARLRRIVGAVNWAAYVAGAIGVANALTLEHPAVQMVCASALIPLPIILVLLALRDPSYVRLDHKEGSQYAQGLTGILATSLALGLMSALDPHTVLGDRFQQYTAGLAALAAAVWLGIEWRRIREEHRLLLVAIHVASIVFLSAAWAGGAIYQLNKNSDVSAPIWIETEVVQLRKSEERLGTAYYVQVATWLSSTPTPIELTVSRATYDKLRPGAAVEVGIRRGALDLPWVDALRLESLRP